MRGEPVLLSCWAVVIMLIEFEVSGGGSPHGTALRVYTSYDQIQCLARRFTQRFTQRFAQRFTRGIVSTENGDVRGTKWSQSP